MKFSRMGLIVSVSVWLLLMASLCVAITRRHDRDDSLYVLSSLPTQFECVGILNDGYAATLIAPQFVLTVAHIGETNPTNIFLGGQLYQVTHIYLAPGWSRDDYAGNDLAILRLDRPVTNITPARLYKGAQERGKVAVSIGTGNFGTGLTGADTPTDRKVRSMKNVIDGTGSDFGYNSRILLSDFDSPDGTNNTLGSLGSSATPEDLEGLVGVGDSGGPVFIQEGGVWYLAGVHATYARRNGNVLDPFAADGRYGDILFSTRVSGHYNWIQSVISRTLGLDINGDGKPDLFWFNGRIGNFAYWLLNGVVQTGTGTLGTGVSSDMAMAAITNAKGDGKYDVLWHNKRTGGVTYWQMDRTTRLGQGTLVGSLPLTWKIAGTPDLNGDGKPDLLWFNSQTRVLAYWLMDGLRQLSNGTLATNIDANWRIVGAPDLNGDGKADLLWQNPTAGTLFYWLMDGTRQIGSGTIDTGIAPAWTITGALDLNGDGNTDLLWRHAVTGELVYWMMSGVVPIQYGTLSSKVSNDWQVCAFQ